ncbi:alpha/beta-hydrolase [Aspergillus sclerotiicarbonarius CBS 121057]|uniref:Alpha/beta-hydrolase n=1 Tax=Aspergillus sclerotiicarbonarius (strain CBS 121057 / IBT 28362) TaxID=1448318 RepID=A0A319ERB8_ASPSB|nr:alpha/beta-hydrolase [Aspergillus sclerotiicarbonarius CBS 121057]
MPPLIFTGLLLSLWAWKCFWIVIMQEKLLYLTWLPPFARSEKIADYEAECKPARWEAHQIWSRDGTKLSVCEGRIPAKNHNLPVSRGNEQPANQSRRKLVVICYFQGNGGSTPMRLPLLTQILRAIHASPQASSEETAYVMVALSYRGFWTSSGRPTQRGIELDMQAFLDWVAETYRAPDTDLQVILWGHSLGSAIATTGLATYLARPHGNGPVASIAGVILEAPSSSVKDMLISLYPQKWLPYRYLWPFLRSHWDSTLAMERMARWRDGDETGAEGAPGHNDEAVMCSGRASSLPPILILSAGQDEVVPPHAADELERVGKRLGLVITRKHVAGALHTEAPVKADGRKTMVDFICQCTFPRTATGDKVRP